MSLTSPETLKFGEISSTRVFAGAAFIVALLEHMFAQKFVDGMLYSPSGVHLRLSHGLLMQSEICAFIARFFEGKHSQQKDVFPTVSEYTERDYGHRCFASVFTSEEGITFKILFSTLLYFIDSWTCTDLLRPLRSQLHVC
ncbi:hypothetical protein Y032_0017g3357 [Ancylostoma ceylanicum]|uniref:Uncharacterized protein n=1 Tax=Ancylostoma ceylanicum TaxID=53326 RepID=A0A016V448_9BILA|nr:hypothetical protein Y032_0017g3357 [Ancylostoma ceylanicum]